MRERRRPRRTGRPLVLALAFALVFAAGVAVGQALEDNPRPGGTETRVRTLQPLPLAPAARETVTVTTSVP